MGPFRWSIVWDPIQFSLKNFFAEVGFEPGFPSWEAGALSITPRAHALEVDIFIWFFSVR